MPCPHFGNYPIEYNRAIHGPFNPMVFYGKRECIHANGYVVSCLCLGDTPLAEVKLQELPAWIWRRNLHPRAVMGAFGRWYYRFYNRFGGAKYASPMILWNMNMIMVCTFSYIIYFKTLRHHKKYKYHW